MKIILNYLFLMKSDRSYYKYLLIATYLCVIFYAIILLWFLFSVPPDRSSAMAHKMGRSTVFLGLYILPIAAISIFSWIYGFFSYVYEIKPWRKFDWLGLFLSLLMPIAYLVLSSIYNAFLAGHGVVIHTFFYNL